MLNKEETKNIPKNTLQYWKKKDYSNVVGKNISFSDENIRLIKTFLENKKLLHAAKGIYFIYSILTSIMENVRGMKTQLRKNMKFIVETIEHSRK